ncbi:MAG TPA: cytochrome c3 family protein [Pirellulales bacterium]|nr:cytochrome c3 family protein [Pirellulales bacterium]
MTIVVWILVAALVGGLVSVAAAWRRSRRSTVRLAAALAGAASAAAFGWLWWSGRSAAETNLPPGLPRTALDDEFVTSATCRSCHPQEYASWHASYHRQMTQPATPEAVKGSFDGKEISLPSGVVSLTRRGDEFWAQMLAGIGYGRRPVKLPERRIVMTTGSHHMQGFWMAHGSGNLLEQLPLMWLVGDAEEAGRWIPVGDSFLAPREKPTIAFWNANCIFCHAVRGKPGLDGGSQTADSEVAELGIACEACHGGGKRHVAAHRNQRPTAEAGARKSAAPDETIVQPARLEPSRSAEVCGRCHAVATCATDDVANEWYRSGSHFRPGDKLAESRLVLAPSRLSPQQLAGLKEEDAAMWEAFFWSDGMVRVVGREYNGLVESACHTRGGMTCLACHSLHHSDPNDQLAAGMETNAACYQCHADYQERLESHTHHQAGSSGSLCYNCHMPHTTYGLFKAIRSHQITSPNVAVTIATGRPNACNLCHLDKPLSWTAAQLTAWYQQSPAELSQDEQAISAAVLGLLRGDAVQRALAAYSFGRPEARRTSGEGWQAPLLAVLLDDPYAAVRMVAYRSLRRLGYDVDYDFVAPLHDRARARRLVTERWRTQAVDVRRAGEGVAVVDREGVLQEDLLDRLLSDRDDRPVRIRE